MTAPELSAEQVATLDRADAEHDYPTETDDGLVWRCRCGVFPPSHQLGQQVDEALWLWTHRRDERLAAVAALVAEARAETEALRERVEALHHPAPTDPAWCDEDGFCWPCPTYRAALTPADTPPVAAAARHPRWQPGTTTDGVTWRTCCASYRHEHHHQPDCPTSRPEASHG